MLLFSVGAVQRSAGLNDAGRYFVESALLFEIAGKLLCWSSGIARIAESKYVIFDVQSCSEIKSRR